jgi:hypothetical protein
LEGLQAPPPGIHKLGPILALDHDDTLQAVVRQLASDFVAPIALITLVLERAQLFLAHEGLSGELAAARAIDRDAAFCPIVVRDKTLFEVSDAATHADIPQEAVERYGVRSYLGAPVSVSGDEVGAVCVVDTQPRQFTDDERAKIRAASEVVTARLDELVSRHASRADSLLARAVRPQFAELRNRLQPMVDGIGSMQVAVAELRAVQRLSDYAAARSPPLEKAALALRDLEEVGAEMAASVTAFERAIFALEHASLASDGSTNLGAIISSASTLAHHHTKLIGGVKWPIPMPELAVAVHLSTAVNTVAAALSGLVGCAKRGSTGRGIEAAFDVQATTVAMRFTGELEPAGIAALATVLAGLLGEAPGIAIGHDLAGLEVVLARK